MATSLPFVNKLVIKAKENKNYIRKKSLLSNKNIELRKKKSCQDCSLAALELEVQRIQSNVDQQLWTGT